MVWDLKSQFLAIYYYIDSEPKSHPPLHPASLTEAQMRRWGVYVSRPLSADEALTPFAEPAVFLVNPAGLLHVNALSNATFARPDLKQLAQGIRMVQDRKLPIRGSY